MKKKYVAYSLLACVGIFALGLGWLGWAKYFSPRHQNIKREVFEQTQSYVHGSVRDLASYFEQYGKATDAADKEAIRQVVVMRFANFDAGQIDNYGLRSFLINMRGY